MCDGRWGCEARPGRADGPGDCAVLCVRLRISSLGAQALKGRKWGNDVARIRFY